MQPTYFILSSSLNAAYYFILIRCGEIGYAVQLTPIGNGLKSCQVLAVAWSGSNYCSTLICSGAKMVGDNVAGCFTGDHRLFDDVDKVLPLVPVAE